MAITGVGVRFPDIIESTSGVKNSKDLTDAGKTEENNERLKEACQEFEAVLWYQVLRAMRKTTTGGGFLSESREMSIYQDMCDEQYAMLLAKQDFAGIGRILYEQLRKK